MAFAISGGSGHGGRFAVRVETAGEALTKARDLVDHDTKEVSIRVVASGKDFTPAEFEAQLIADAFSESATSL